MHIGIKTGIVNELRAAQRVAEGSVQAVVAAGGDDVVILGFERLEGGDGGMDGAHGAGDHAGGGILDDGVFQDSQLAVQHTDVDHIALAGDSALIQGGNGAESAEDAGNDIADGSADADGLAAGFAGDAHNAAHGLHDHIIGGTGRVGAGLAEAGDGDIDELGIDLLQFLVAQAHAVHGAGFQVLHDDIDVLDQLLEHLDAFGILGVADDAFFAMVDADKVTALAVDERTVAAAVIAGTGLFYLDDLGAHVAQHHGAVGTGQRVGEIQNADPFQRFFRHS